MLSPEYQTGVKYCSRCRTLKALTNFYKRTASRDGLNNVCKPCDIEGRRLRDLANPDKAKARYARYRRTEKRAAAQAAHYRRHRDRLLAKGAEYKKATPEHVRREMARSYYQANKEDWPARTAERRARQKQAIPAWANRKSIALLYRHAIKLTRVTGVKHHVDHIVPLQHKLVCGLHCEANLRVIPAQENWVKNNKYWPEMP